MQFISNGPDIPEEIIRHLEDDELVLFCGAGVSMGEGLPSFKGLVKKVYDSLNRPLDNLVHPFEFELYNSGQFDRCLGELERCLGSKIVREKVIEQVTLPEDTELLLHSALLTLARNDDNQFRLVTTNFDHGFRQLEGVDLNIDKAPLLRVPKKVTWSNPVYLHGAIDQSDEEARDLVITSADFGMAYLTERWASTFVTELLRRFNILFIGYSVNDPVFRYLMDAVAADKKIHADEFKNQYVLVANDDDYDQEQWDSAQIIPITYNNELGDHKLLSDSLIKWASRKGRHSKKAIVADFAENPPVQNSPEHSLIAAQLKWALSDSSGIPSLLFSQIAHEGWIEFLVQEGLLSEIQEIETKLMRPDPFPGPMSEVLWNLSKWVTKSLESNGLIDVVIQAGGFLHPRLASLVEIALNDKGASIPSKVRKFWQLCLTISRDANYSYGMREGYNFIDALNYKIEVDELKLIFDRTFDLKIQLSKPMGYFNKRDGAEDERLSDLVEIRVDFYGGSAAKDLRETLAKSCPHMFEPVAESCVAALERMYRILHIIERVDSRYDHSTINLSSVKHIEGINHYYEAWTHFPPLIIEAVERALQGERFDWVMNIYAKISSSSYPLFQRMAFSICAKLLSTDRGLSQAISLLEINREYLFWSTEVQPEIFSLFKALVQIKQDDLIQEIILEGPNRENFNSSMDDDEWALAEDRLIFGRLGKLEEYGADLCEKLQAISDEILDRREGWKVPTDEEGNYPFQMLDGDEVAPFDTREPIDFVAASEEEIVQFLDSASHGDNTDVLWGSFSKNAPDSVLAVLDFLLSLDEGNYKDHTIRMVSDSFRENAITDGIEGRLLFWEYWIDGKIPTIIIGKLSEYLQSDADTIPEQVVINAFDKMRSQAIDCPLEIDCLDAYSLSINHPVGWLFKSLVTSFWRDKRKPGEGLPTWFVERIEGLLENAEGSSLRAFGAMLGANSMHIHYVDPEWSQSFVLPLFDVPNDLSVSMWEGYLTSYRTNVTHVEKLIPYITQTIANQVYELIDERLRFRLYILLARVALDVPEIFSRSALYKVLLDAPERAKVEILNLCQNLVKGAEEPNVFWDQQIRNFIDESWPKTQGFITQRTAKKFVGIVQSLNPIEMEHFEFIEPYLTQIDGVGDYFYYIKKMDEGHVNVNVMLKLLSKVAPETMPGYEAEYMKSTLLKWREENAGIDSSQDFQRLVHIIESSGIPFP